MKVVISAGGRFHALALANQLEKRDSLKRLFTFYYTTKDKNLLNSKYVSNFGFNKFLDNCWSKFRLSKFINKTDYYYFKDNLFDNWVSNQIQKEGQIDIFVGWANYFLKSLPNIRKTGAKIIVESGSCHILEQQRLLQQEYDKFGFKNFIMNPKNREKMLSEYDQADYIMTISSFVYESFAKNGLPKKKLLKVTCGFDYDYFYQKRDFCKNNKKFKVLFVGLVGLRKGVQYLLQAWEKLNFPKETTELILVGNIEQDIQNFLKNFKHISNISFHGSCDKIKLKELYSKVDLFVLPSVEDGFGMVIPEAMASGIPVICSTNTAANDLIENHKNGFIIPACDSIGLAEKIEWIYKNREEAFFMGLEAQKQSAKFSWDSYGENIFRTYKSIL